MPNWIDYIWGPTASVSDIENPQLSMYSVNGLLHINNFSSEKVSLNIVNMLGATVKEISIEQGESRVELDFPKGVYVASSSLEGRLYTLKFIR